MENIKSKRHNVTVIDSSNKRKNISDSDEEMDERNMKTVRAAVSRAEVCKKPIAKYDAAAKKAYVVYPNGSRVDVR